MENLKGIKRVRFCDYTEYDSEKCNNGGAYGFWTNYFRLDNDEWKVSYGTTADFSYCPVCGSFNDHYKGDDCYYKSSYSCGEFKIITEKELLKRINNFQETECKYIEFDEKEKSNFSKILLEEDNTLSKECKERAARRRKERFERIERRSELTFQKQMEELEKKYGNNKLN